MKFNYKFENKNGMKKYREDEIYFTSYNLLNLRYRIINGKKYFTHFEVNRKKFTLKKYKSFRKAKYNALKYLCEIKIKIYHKYK